MHYLVTVMETRVYKTKYKVLASDQKEAEKLVHDWEEMEEVSDEMLDCKSVQILSVVPMPEPASN